LPFYTGTALMTAGDTIETLPDEPRIGVITSTEPKEVALPGYLVEDVKQFDSLYFLWLKRF
jgi:hypothetical protein